MPHHVSGGASSSTFRRAGGLCMERAKGGCGGGGDRSDGGGGWGALAVWTTLGSGRPQLTTSTSGFGIAMLSLDWSSNLTLCVLVFSFLCRGCAGVEYHHITALPTTLQSQAQGQTGRTRIGLSRGKICHRRTSCKTERGIACVCAPSVDFGPTRLVSPAKGGIRGGAGSGRDEREGRERRDRREKS